MTRAAETEEDARAREYLARELLFCDLVNYVRARASRCFYCPAIAYWVHRCTAPGASGFPREDLLCDAHRVDGSVPIPGAGVVRRAWAVR